MDFFVLNWSDGDEEVEEDSLRYMVYLWGVNADGQTVCVRSVEKPYFYVRIRDLNGTSEHEFCNGCRRMVSTFDGFDSVKRVYGKPFTGYQAHTEPFLKLTFNSQKAMRFVSKAVRVSGLRGVTHQGMPAYETQVPPVIRVMHAHGISATGWCRVEGDVVMHEAVTKADIEVDPKTISPLTRESFAPMVVATFDIEVYSSMSTTQDPVFPCATNDKDVIVAIVTIFTTVTDPNPFYEHVLTLEGSDLEGVDCVVCSSERELLDKWAREIVERKAMIWVHFNGMGFDEEYMYTRAVRTGANELLHMGWFCNRMEPIELRKSTMESAAYGYNSFAFMVVEGVFHLDLMVAIKKDFNLQSYSLNFCGEYFCNDKKIDLPPQKQFDLYRSGKMREILEYCVQDVRLTLRIASKLSMVTALVEMAGQTSVPVDYLITRGQQIKMLASIVRFAAPKNYFLEATQDLQTGEDGYKGATVLEPVKGCYFSVVACLDFASLYPSIMRAHNLSHETWIRDGKVLEGATQMNNGQVFMQHPTGILTLLLEKWSSDRKMNKQKMMEFEKLAHESGNPQHKFMEKVYDARQKANKVCMNSLYGFCGVSVRGMQPCSAIASTVTRWVVSSMCERVVPLSLSPYYRSGTSVPLCTCHGAACRFPSMHIFPAGAPPCLACCTKWPKKVLLWSTRPCPRSSPGFEQFAMCDERRGHFWPTCSGYFSAGFVGCAR